MIATCERARERLDRMESAAIGGNFRTSQRRAAIVLLW